MLLVLGFVIGNIGNKEISVIFYKNILESVFLFINLQSIKVTASCFGFLLKVRVGFRVRVRFRDRVGLRVMAL